MRTWQVQRARPPVTYAAVAALYRSPGAAGDYAEAVIGDLAFDGSGLGVLAVSCWVRAAVGADTPGFVVWGISDDGSPGLALRYDSSEVTVPLTDDTGATADEIRSEVTDGAWHHIFACTRAGFPDFADGVQYWYDGDCPADGVAPPAGPFATAVALLRLFAGHDGADRLAGDIANVAFFTSLPAVVEISALYAAGVTHDVRNPSGRWRRRKPEAYYRDADTAGVVANVGKLVAALVFNGDVTSEVL